jgi:hypothetical protein
MNLANLEFHELAEEFPMISDNETQQLADDIKKNGLLDRIMLLDGKILDGRNRYKASQLAGMHLGPENVEMFEEAFPGDDPIIYVIGKNIHRRHLTVGQRSAVAHELFKRMAKMPGTAKEKVKKAADTVGVAASSVEQAGHIAKVAPAIHKEVKKGKKTLHKAAKEVAKIAGNGDEHDAAFDRVQAVCGKAFAGAVKEDSIPALTTPKQVVTFAALSDDKMKQLAPALRLGWKMNRALSFMDKELSPASTLAAAMDLFAFKGAKKYEFELDGCKFVVTKAASEKAES